MYPFRKELVGKRFLFVRSSEKGSRPSSRSTRASNPLDYQWKSGVIRACNEKDCHAKELQVLVEYEGEDWITRDWLPVYTCGFRIFLVEKALVWAQRADPSNSRKSVLWPALTFTPLVDLHKLENEPCPIPVEFLGDHKRSFVKPSDMRPYQDDDGLQPSLRSNGKVVGDLTSWQRLQKSQAILMDGPFTLTGFRVQVYRQNFRQWFSAVITSHDLLTRELNVMDDTVLQTHRVEPALVQVVLLANDAELDSLLRGETVRVLPVRQHRQSQVIITSTCTLATTTSTPSSVSSWQLFQELSRGVAEHPAGNLVTVNQHRHTNSYVQPVATSVASYPKPVETSKESTKKERRKSDSRNRSYSKSRKSTEGNNSKVVASSSTTITSTSSSTPALTVSQSSQFRNYLNSSRTSQFLKQDVAETERELSSPKMTSAQLQSQQEQPQIFSQSSPFQNQEAIFHSVRGSSPQKQPSHTVTSSPVLGITSPCRTPPASYPSSSHSSGHTSSSSHSSPQHRHSKSPARYPEKQVSSPIHNLGSLNKMTLPPSPYATSPAISTINQSSPKDGAFHPLHNVSPQIGLLPSPNHSPVCAVPLSNHHSVSPGCQYLHHHAVLPSSPAQDHLHMLQYQQQHFQQCQRAKQVQHAPTHLDIHQQYQQYQQYLSRTYNQVLQRYLLAYHQLQMLIKQQKTPEQQQTLNHYQSQVLYLYQEAQLVQKLSAHAQHQYEQNLVQFESQMQLLPDQIQEHIHAAQEQQRQLQQPRLDPEKLQAFFQQIQQQNSSPEQVSKLYGQLVEQQQQVVAPKHKPNAQHQAPYRHMLQQQEEQQTLVQYLHQHQEQLRKIVDGSSEQEKSRGTQDSKLLQNTKSLNASSSDSASKVLSINDFFQQNLEPSLAASKPCTSKTTSEKDLNSKVKSDTNNVSQQSSKDNDERSTCTSKKTTVAPEIKETITGCESSKAVVVPDAEEQGKQKNRNTATQPSKRNVSSAKKASELDISKRQKLSEVSVKDDSKVQIATEDLTNAATNFSTASDETPSGTSKNSSSTTSDSIAYPSLPGAFSGFINLEYIGSLANLPFSSGSSTAESPEILSFSLGSSTSSLYKNLSDSSSFQKREQSPGFVKATTASTTDAKQHSPSSSPTTLPAALVQDAREMATESLRRIADIITANQEDIMDISTSEIIAHNQDRPSVIKISPTRKKPGESLKESVKLESVADDVDKLNPADKQSEELKVQQSSAVKTRKPRSKKRKAKEEVIPSENKAQKIESSQNLVSAAASTKQQVKCTNFLEPSQLTKRGLKQVSTQCNDQYTGDVAVAAEKRTSKSKGKKKSLLENGELCENRSTSAVTPAEVETTCVQSLPGFQSKPLQSFSHIQTKPMHLNHCKSSSPQLEKQPLVNPHAVSTITGSVADFSTNLVENSLLNFVSDQSVNNLSVAHDAPTQKAEHNEFEMFTSLSGSKNDVGLEPVKEKKKRERRSKKERTTGKKERQRKRKKVKVSDQCLDSNAASSLPTELKRTSSEAVGTLEGPVSCESNAIPSFEEKLDIVYNMSEPLDKEGLCSTSVVASGDVYKMYGTSTTLGTVLPSVQPHMHQYMPGEKQKEDTKSAFPAQEHCDVRTGTDTVKPRTSTKEYNKMPDTATSQSQMHSRGKLKMPDVAPLQSRSHTESPHKMPDVAPTQTQMHTQIPCKMSGVARVQPQVHTKGPQKMPDAKTVQTRLHGQSSHNIPEFPAVYQEMEILGLNELPDGTHGREQIQPQETFEVLNVVRMQSKMHEIDEGKLLASSDRPKTAEGPGLSLPSKRSPQSSSSPPLYEYQLPGVHFHATGLNSGCLPTEQMPMHQPDVREEKSAMETVNRLVAEKRQSLQKAKNKKRQQEDKKTKPGRKSKEEKKKNERNSSSPTEHTEATRKINPVERSPSEIMQSLEQQQSTEQDCRVEMKLSAEEQSLHYVKPVDNIERPLLQSKVSSSSKNSMEHEMSADPNNQPSDQVRAVEATKKHLKQKRSVESILKFSEQEGPVIRTEKTFVQDELLDCTKQSLKQYNSIKSLEKRSKQGKALLSSSTLKYSEGNKSTDATKKSSKKDKTFYSINKSSKKGKAKGSKKSSKRDQKVESIKHSSEQRSFEQDKPENSVKKASEENRLTTPSEKLFNMVNPVLQSGEVKTDCEGTLPMQKKQSEEKRFTELKKLLEAKKLVEAKKLCEERCINEETKHAVVKELVEEKKLAQSKKQAKRNTEKDLAWEKNFIQMKKLTKERMMATPVPAKKAVSAEDKKTQDGTKLPLDGEGKAKEIEHRNPGEGNGGEVVVKRKRGRPRKQKTEDKNIPESGGSAAEKSPKKRRKKATGLEDDGRPMEKKIKKEKREKKEKKENNEESETQQPEEFFIQEGACHTLPTLPKCRECRELAEGESPLGQECCRFNLFRRLKRRMHSNTVHIAGFLLPEHAGPEDKMLWHTLDNIKNVLDKEKALYIINNIGNEFCSLVDQEKKALALAGTNAPVTYKRAVRGVREMCDACATTIFNIHWVCHRCGFGVCLDCYRLRLKERSEQPGGSVKRVFEFRWMACSPGFQHQPQFLNVAQIIPQNLLNELREELHATRKAWNIEEGNCPCCPGGKPVLEEIAREEIKEGKEEMENKSENSHSSDIQPSSADDQSTDGINVAVKTEEMPKEDIEKTNEEIDGQDCSMSSSETKDDNIMCNEKLETPSPEQMKLECEEKTDRCSSKGAVPRTVAKVMSDMVVPLTDVCTAGQKVGWKEKPVKIQPLKFTDGLSRLMDYETSSGESTPLDSPAVGKTDGKPAPHTSFAFPPPATSEQLNDNLNLLAHLASLHSFSPPKQDSPAAATEKPVKERVDVSSNSSSDKGENLTASATKDTPKDTPKETPEEEVDEPVVHTSNPVASVGEATKTESTEDAESRARAALVPRITDTHPAPHSWFCNGRLLRLHEAHHPGNLKAFQHNWTKGEPVLVSHVDKVMNLKLWVPESFEEEFGSEISDVVNCKNGTTIPDYQVGEFWRGFESMKDRPKDSSGQPMILKLKDWPPGADFCEKLPTRFENLMENIPVPEYTTRTGVRNLAARLPDFFVKPDLGPKMYNAYGSAAFPHEGTTNLHVDMSDAVNVLMYVGVPRDPGVAERERGYAIAAVDAACDETQQQRVRVETERIGAMWHIYPADDADKIRACLRQHAKEMKMKYPAHHDPIHDQCFYLDHGLRERLKKEYNVEGYAICQCLGDAVFIPAGAPHQVRNLYNCVKVAEDFVSPEHIHHCFEITQEFRHLSDKHTNHEDKLQIKNIIFHAVKDAIGALKKYEETRNEKKEETEKVKEKHEMEDKEETIKAEM